MIGWPALFWTNEFLKGQFGVTHTTSEDNTVGNMLIRSCIGGVSGQMGWIVGYPFDVMMVKIMTTTDRNLTIREAFITGYRSEGVRYFYKGLQPCLIRAFATGFVNLPAFEYMLNNWMPDLSD